MAGRHHRALGCTAAIALLTTACTGGSTSPSTGTATHGATRAGAAGATATTAATNWTCPAPSDTALPPWARGGFKDPTSPQPHLLAERGTIVAIPFGWPLHAPRPAPGKGNKILWVAKAGNGIGPLRITATERTSGRTTTVVLPDGPGPSYVDVPTPGCWRFVLSWDNQHDTVFVHYYSPTPA